jgi:hypothetical protein
MIKYALAVGPTKKLKDLDFGELRDMLENSVHGP